MAIHSSCYIQHPHPSPQKRLAHREQNPSASKFAGLAPNNAYNSHTLPLSHLRRSRSKLVPNSKRRTKCCEVIRVPGPFLARHLDCFGRLGRSRFP